MNTQIYNVLPGRPFGRGTSTTTLSADPCARANCSGTSGSTSLTVGDKQGTFSDGDLVLIHQTRDSSDQTNWEVNQIVSGASGATFTLANALGRTYTSNTGSSSAVRAQVVKIVEYSTLTINSFTGTGWRATASYNGNGWGGIVAIAVANTCTITGTPELNGKIGWRTTQDQNTSPSSDYYVHASTVGGGFRGGWNSTDTSTAGAGEGYTGSFVTETTVNQGSGGGAAQDSGGSGGGGGGNGTAGTTPGDGDAGSASGTTDLTKMWFGGGGGGGSDRGAQGPSGGGGGGIFVIWAKKLVVSGGLQAKGGSGLTGSGAGPRPSGGGAGGSILLNIETGDLGTNLVVASGGTSGGGLSGVGGDGRIRINYGASFTGTTSPTLNSAKDNYLSTNMGLFISGGL